MPDNVRVPDIDGCPARDYRVVAVEIPASPFDAIEAAFDLDDDGVRDNWLGLATALVHAWSAAFEPGAHAGARLVADVDWRLVVHQCDAGGAASAGLGAAGDPVETARGDRAPGGTPLVGGTFAVPLGVLSDAVGGADPGWTAAPLAQIRLDAFDDRGATATLGVAVASADVTAIVVPNLAAFFTAQLAGGDSAFAAEADTDGDGEVTPAELVAHDTARLLLAPDLEPQLDLPTGGASLGVRLRAVAVRD